MKDELSQVIEEYEKQVDLLKKENLQIRQEFQERLKRLEDAFSEMFQEKKPQK